MAAYNLITTNISMSIIYIDVQLLFYLLLYIGNNHHNSYFSFPSLIKLTCKNLIIPSPTEFIIIIILTALNIVYHKPEYLFEHEVLQEKDIVPYLVPMFMISFLVKAISLLIFLTINSLISCSKYFTKLLLKHNNPSKYIAKYVLTASSSFFGFIRR